VLGPVLFLVYINDLPEWVKSPPRLFADDCLLHREINTKQDTETLQRDLDSLQEWEKTWLMEFAEEKCKVLRITKKIKRNTIFHDYKIHGHNLEAVHEANYLGVTLHDKLSFTPHIDHTLKKAATTRQFLQRNLRGCNREVKETSYKTFVRPVLEYAATVWDPAGHKTNQKRLEAEQNRAARFVVNDYRRTTSMTGIINQLRWDALAERRAKAKVTMVYRMLTGLVFIPQDLLNPSSTPSRTRGATYKLPIPHSRTDLYRNHFVVSAAHMWNGLPSSVAQADNIESFKSQLALVRLT
jgi:hypothetical protein